MQKSPASFAASRYWSSKLLGAEEIGDFGDYYQWGSLVPGKPDQTALVFYDVAAQTISFLSKVNNEKIWSEIALKVRYFA